MLNKVRYLGESITRDQIKGLKDILGDSLYNMLDLAFEAKTEDEVNDRILSFVSEAKRSPLKIMKARRLLSDEQKSIIMEFLD